MNNKPLTLAQRLRITSKAMHHLGKAGGHLFRAVGMLRLLGDEHRHRVEALQEGMSSAEELGGKLKDELLKHGACRWCGLTGNVHDARCRRLQRDFLSDNDVIRRFVDMITKFEQTGELYVHEDEFQTPPSEKPPRVVPPPAPPADKPET